MRSPSHRAGPQAKRFAGSTKAMIRAGPPDSCRLTKLPTVAAVRGTVYDHPAQQGRVETVTTAAWVVGGGPDSLLRLQEDQSILEDALEGWIPRSAPTPRGRGGHVGSPEQLILPDRSPPSICLGLTPDDQWVVAELKRGSRSAGRRWRRRFTTACTSDSIALQRVHRDARADTRPFNQLNNQPSVGNQRPLDIRKHLDEASSADHDARRDIPSRRHLNWGSGSLQASGASGRRSERSHVRSVQRPRMGKTGPRP